MSEIDCCGRWTDCAAEGRCMNSRYADACAYSIHLANGFNFLNTDFKSGPYLVVNNRLFYIGRKSHVGSHHISADTGAALSNLGFRFSPFCLDNARAERSSDDNPCSYRVVVTALDDAFVVLNANIRMMQQSTALQVRDYLRYLGFPARIELIGTPGKSSKSVATVSSDEVSQSVPASSPAASSKYPQPLPEQTNTHPPLDKSGKSIKADLALPLPGQVSIFDL